MPAPLDAFNGLSESAVVCCRPEYWGRASGGSACAPETVQNCSFFAVWGWRVLAL